MTVAKCVGFFDRQGIKPGTGNQTSGDDFNASRGNNAWPNSAYNALLGGFVMRSINSGGSIAWSELEPTGETNTATGVGVNTMTRTGAGWTNGQWVGGVVSLGGAPSAGGSYGVITANSPSQLTVVSWVGGQPAAGVYVLAGPIAGSAGTGASAIDHSFYVADGYNASNPAQNWTCKLRIFLGESAPTWAQNLGVGPITGTVNPCATPPDNSSNTTTAWWDATYEQAFECFMIALAHYVPTYTVTWTGGGQSAGANTHALDGHPLFGEITEACCMTKYGEPCMKDDFNSCGNTDGSGMDAAVDAGMTDNAEFNKAASTGTQCSAMKGMVLAFPNSSWSFACNPFLTVGSGGNSAGKDITKTTALTDYLVGAGLNPVVSPNCGAAFPQAVMENNSLRGNVVTYPPPNGPGPYSDRNSDYTTMYTKFAGYTDGQAAEDMGLTEPIQPMPLCIQTSTLTGMTSGGTSQHDALVNTINYAIWLGARMVELPGDGNGYAVIGTTGADLAFWQNAGASLRANDPVVAGTGYSPFRRRHWKAFTHR